MVFTSVLNLIYDTQLHPDRVYIQWAADAEPRPFLASLLSAWWQVEFQVKPSIISELIGRGARCTGKQPWSTFPSINILQWLYRCGLKIPVLSNIPESHYTNETRNVIAWLMEHGATYECVPYNLLHQMYKDDPRFEHPATKIILRSYMMTGGWIGQLMDVREHHLGVYSIYALMTANNHTEALNWIQERRINLVSILAEVVIEVPLPLYLIITDFYFDPCNFIWCKGFKELCVSQRAILEFELQKFRQTNLQGKLFDPDPKSGIDS
jgi:hypothetical protein